MAAEFIPVRARRGRVVHLTTNGAGSDGLTLCGRPTDGFAIATTPATCKTCKRCAP